MHGIIETAASRLRTVQIGETTTLEKMDRYSWVGVGKIPGEISFYEMYIFETQGETYPKDTNRFLLNHGKYKLQNLQQFTANYRIFAGSLLQELFAALLPPMPEVDYHASCCCGTITAIYWKNSSAYSDSRHTQIIMTGNSGKGFSALA